MGALGIYDSNPVQLFNQDIRAGMSQIAVSFEPNMLRWKNAAWPRGATSCLTTDMR
jgi:hypothetical protein